jgi:acyl-CoA thioesterase YciA
MPDPSALEPAIRVAMLPRDTNAHGTIFGGVLLSYIDQAGGIEAQRHCASRVVTVAMREVVFKRPVLVGDVVSFYAQTLALGRTSVTVRVTVEATRLHEGQVQRIPVTEAEVVYVAVDSQGRPVPVGSEPPGSQGQEAPGPPASGRERESPG